MCPARHDRERPPQRSAAKVRDRGAAEVRGGRRGGAGGGSSPQAEGAERGRRARQQQPAEHRRLRVGDVASGQPEVGHARGQRPRGPAEVGQRLEPRAPAQRPPDRPPGPEVQPVPAAARQRGLEARGSGWVCVGRAQSHPSRDLRPPSPAHSLGVHSPDPQPPQGRRAAPHEPLRQRAHPQGRQVQLLAPARRHGGVGAAAVELRERAARAQRAEERAPAVGPDVARAAASRPAQITASGSALHPNP